MLYFTIFEQHKSGERIETHSGTGDSRERYLPVSEQITFMYQYSIYEEGVSWADLSSHMTEGEFNELVEKGQRLFLLETPYSRFTVKIEDYDEIHESSKKIEQSKIDLELFDDLKCWCFNFVNGFYLLDEFNRMLKTLEEFDRDKNKKVFDVKITQIENDIDSRQEAKVQ